MLRVVGRLLRLEGEGSRRGQALVRVAGRRRQADVEAEDFVRAGVKRAIACLRPLRRVTDDVDAGGAAQVAGGVYNRAVDAKTRVGAGGHPRLDRQVKLRRKRVLRRRARNSVAQLHVSGVGHGDRVRDLITRRHAAESDQSGGRRGADVQRTCAERVGGHRSGVREQGQDAEAQYRDQRRQYSYCGKEFSCHHGPSFRADGKPEPLRTGATAHCCFVMQDVMGADTVTSKAEHFSKNRLGPSHGSGAPSNLSGQRVVRSIPSPKIRWEKKRRLDGLQMLSADQSQRKDQPGHSAIHGVRVAPHFIGQGRRAPSACRTDAGQIAS